MIIREKGHVYELEQLDYPIWSTAEEDAARTHVCPRGAPVVLKFVNRESGTEHEGTQTQEVLRALIDRTQHCDSCLPWAGNDLIIHHLRMALALHEVRAILRKTEKGLILPERIQTSRDGHFALTRRSMEHFFPPVPTDAQDAP